MIHYNNDNNAYCPAVIAKNSETRGHNNAVYISTFLHTSNLSSYSHLEIFICIYSVRGEIDQILTTTLRYTMCSAPNVYMFVYTLIGTHIVPLTELLFMKGNHHEAFVCTLTLKELVMTIDALGHFETGQLQHCTVEGNEACRGGEVRAGTTSPMPDHKGFRLQ